MTPHSLSTVSISNAKTPAQRRKEMGWAGRHPDFGKGVALPETQVPACPRVKVADLPEGFLKQNHIEALEHNQQIRHCCRHPENHEIEARKSHPDEQVPDIYVFHCTCGRKHIMFCVGLEDTRPMWDAA
jgi:hypothetical protein